MNRVGNTHGYTIVETMIFLAVSALMFTSAILLINSQQKRTQFSTAVHDFASEIQSVMGNVASGYYNNVSGQTTCTNSGGFPAPSSGGSAQGTNADCTFLGQVLVSPQGGNTTDFQIISLVGLRRAGLPPVEVTSLTQAVPTLFSATKRTYSIAGGADFVSMKTSATTIGSVGFLSSFAQYDASTNLLASGAGHTDVYPIISGSTTPGSGIENELRTAPQAPNPTSITICLTDGGNRRALITLSGGSTNSVLGDNTLCN